MEHPVGTGPYRLKSWLRGQKIVLEANPDFRDFRYPQPPTGDSADATIAKDLVGRPLPLVGSIEISIIEEGQPRLLTFESGKLDYLALANPHSLAENVLDSGRLKPAFAHKGIVLHRGVEPALDFVFFNIENPVVGGYAPAKVALRRAVGLGYDRDTAIRILKNGQAVPASQPVPPSLFGHDPAAAAKSAYDPAAARALLDKFGYKDRDGDGYRENPDGTRLTLVNASTTDAAARVRDELWKKNMDDIGVRMTFLKNKWPELNKMSEAGQLMMWGLGWIASTPDGDPFYSYLYSKNIGTSNDARLRLPQYDDLYERAHALSDSDERNALFRKMTDLILAYAPWIMADYPYYNVVAQPWLKGFKFNPFKTHQWQYYDIDTAARP